MLADIDKKTTSRSLVALFDISAKNQA